MNKAISGLFESFTVNPLDKLTKSIFRYKYTPIKISLNQTVSVSKKSSKKKAEKKLE